MSSSVQFTICCNNGRFALVHDICIIKFARTGSDFLVCLCQNACCWERRWWQILDKLLNIHVPLLSSSVIFAGQRVVTNCGREGNRGAGIGSGPCVYFRVSVYRVVTFNDDKLGLQNSQQTDPREIRQVEFGTAERWNRLSDCIERHHITGTSFSCCFCVTIYSLLPWHLTEFLNDLALSSCDSVCSLRCVETRAINIACSFLPLSLPLP